MLPQNKLHYENYLRRGNLGKWNQLSIKLGSKYSSNPLAETDRKSVSMKPS